MRIIFVISLLAFAASANAAMYKWVDEEGNVHYSQKRPETKEYKKIKKQATPKSAGQPLYQGSNTAPGKNTKPANKAIAEKETAKNEAQRQKNCAGAKQNLEAYQIYRRFKDKDGNAVRIDDAERDKKIKESQEAISSFCN